MTRILTIIAFLFATPVWAAGSYSYEPSASKLINDAKKLIKKEKYKRAIGKLEKAQKEEPNNADIFNYLGFAHRKIGDYENSKIFYKEALAIQPDHKLALEYQGELFLTLHDINSAQSNLRKLEALCPQGCDELKDLGNAVSKYEAEHGD
jgi:tetratricopeptide (TPR) repeat protein